MKKFANSMHLRRRFIIAGVIFCFLPCFQKTLIKNADSWAEIYFVPYPFFDKNDILVHISQCYTVPSPHDVWRLDLAYLLRKSVFDTVPSSPFGLILRSILFHVFIQPISIRSLVTCECSISSATLFHIH